MRWGVFGLVLVVLALVQTTALRALPPAAAACVDLLLMLALVCGLRMPVRSAVTAGWIVGLAVDLLSLDALGSHAIGLALTALAIGRLRDWLRADLTWVRVAICLTAGASGLLATALVNRAHDALWRPSAPGVWHDFVAGLPSLLIAAVVVGVALPLPGLVRHYVLRRRRRAARSY